MRIENEMLSRMKTLDSNIEPAERSLSAELDFFFDNVMDTVVDFFQTKEELKF